MSSTTAPTQAGFLAFIRNVMEIPVEYLPDNSPVIGYSFTTAMAIVNPGLACVPSPPGAWTVYALAVYNLAADTLINFAPDQPGREKEEGSFTKLRLAFSTATFVPGVIASAGNSPTTQSTLNPEFMKNFTMRDLRNLKTPYGRAYLELAADWGSLWGIS